MFMKGDDCKHEFFYRICSTIACHKIIGCKTNSEVYSCGTCENICKFFNRDLEDSYFQTLHKRGMLTYTMCEACLEQTLSPNELSLEKYPALQVVS